jgi:UDP-N-acetylglucosamine 4,6-dehydratase
MWGGETFIPKIPSATIETVAEAVAPGMPRRTVGIRPGEKLHEVLCLPDTAHETLQFERHYVIKPSFKFGRVDVDYRKAANGEIGRPVAEDFGYNSRDNPEFMTPDSLRKMIDEAMPFE